MSKSIYKTFQNHHITPKCLLKHKSKEFIDHHSNIVRLRYDHHIAIHKWLFMLTGNAGLESAYISMISGKFYYNNEGKNHPRYGTRHSPESIEKNKLSHLGKIHKKESIVKMSGKYNHRASSCIINGKYFDTLREAGIFFNTSHSVISYWIKTNKPLCYKL